MNITSTRAAEGLDRRAFTVAEIRRSVEAGIIPEDGSFELIDGDLVARHPRGNDDEIIRSALGCDLVRRALPDIRVAACTTLYLDERTFLEPDICLYPRRLLPEDVKGADVLLAIEVAASSMSYDRGLKASIYARHGVRELWVVDAATRDTWVHRRPQADGHWGSIERNQAETLLAPAALPDVAVRMADLD
jgi:Uma2 family endonuclease